MAKGMKHRYGGKGRVREAKEERKQRRHKAGKEGKGIENGKTEGSESLSNVLHSSMAKGMKHRYDIKEGKGGTKEGTKEGKGRVGEGIVIEQRTQGIEFLFLTTDFVSRMAKGMRCRYDIKEGTKFIF